MEANNSIAKILLQEKKHREAIARSGISRESQYTRPLPLRRKKVASRWKLNTTEKNPTGEKSKLKLAQQFGKFNKMSQLLISSQTGKRTTVRYMLHLNADDIAASNHRYPLHEAAKIGSIGILQEFIKKGVNINSSDSRGRRALHYAVAGGFSFAISMLFHNGADVFVTDKEGNSAMHFAAQKGQLTAAKVLMQHGAVVDELNKRDQTPLYTACVAGHMEMVKFLMSTTDLRIIDSYGDSILHASVRHQRKEIASMLLDVPIIAEQINITNNIGESALHIAISAGDHELFDMLLSVNNSDPNLRGIIKKSKTNYKCEEKEKKKMTLAEAPIHLCARLGHTEMLQSLIQRGADIEIKNANKESPLFIARKYGFFDCADILLNFGALEYMYIFIINFKCIYFIPNFIPNEFRFLKYFHQFIIIPPIKPPRGHQRHKVEWDKWLKQSKDEREERRKEREKILIKSSKLPRRLSVAVERDPNMNFAASSRNWPQEEFSCVQFRATPLADLDAAFTRFRSKFESKLEKVREKKTIFDRVPEFENPESPRYKEIIRQRDRGDEFAMKLIRVKEEQIERGRNKLKPKPVPNFTEIQDRWNRKFQQGLEDARLKRKK